jgi:hypothetical protein
MTRISSSLQSLRRAIELWPYVLIAISVSEHARLGLSIYIGRGGKVVELSADEVLELSRSTHAK